MQTAETLQKIRKIELRTRHLVNQTFAGAYESVFKGRGIEFDTVRPYVPGDDVRDIDWNVTARTGDPHLKSYVEERELTVMLVLDVSGSFLFGTAERQKRDLAAELGAVLAFSAILNNDKVGMLIFSDQIEKYISPRKGRKHVLRLIRDLLVATPASRGTDLSLALKSVNRVLNRRAIIFLISDFLVDTATYERDLMVLARRHDVIALVATDPREEVWPDAGLVRVRDAETGAVKTIDTGDSRWRRAFQKQVSAYQESRDAALVRAQVDRIDVPVDGDYLRALMAFFRRRSR